MSFDTKKILADWKKAKPFLLMDTGVSAVLRALPENPKFDQIGEFTAAIHKLDDFIADPKIKKEAKAVACLKQIKEHIEKYIARAKADRAIVVRDMGQICKLMQDYFVILQKGPKTNKLMLTFHNKIGGPRKHMDITTAGQSDIVVPLKILSDFNTGERTFERHFLDMERTVKSIEGHGETPALKKIVDTCMKECKHGLAEIVKATKLAKAL